MPPAANLEVWFLTGSQALYGDAVLSQVLEQSAAIARELDQQPGLAVRIVHRPVLTTAASIRQECMAASASPVCVGVIAWMHTFSPAKAWIAGLDVLSKPLLHLHTQFNLRCRGPTIDMDFMNLNQAAHGDREFGFIETRMRIRRKTVVGHCSDSATRARIAAWARAAVGWHESQNLRVARFGDNMRDVAVTEGDKVEAQIRFGLSVNTCGSTNSSTSSTASTTRTIDGLLTSTRRLRPWQVRHRPAPRHDSLRYAARIEAGLRAFLTDGGFGAFTTNFEDLGGLKAAGIASSGSWRTATDSPPRATGRPPSWCGVEGHGRAAARRHVVHGGLHLPLRARRAETLGAHMLEVCPSITARNPASCEIHPLGIGEREDPVRLVFAAAPGPGFVVGMLDLGDRFRLVANTSKSYRRTTAAESCRSPARSGSAHRASRRRQRPGSPQGGRTTPP